MNIIKKIFGMIAIIVVSVVMFFPTDKVSALTKISLNKQNIMHGYFLNGGAG